MRKSFSEAWASEVEIAFALAEDQEQVDKALDLRERGARIGHIVYDNPRGIARYTAPGLLSWKDLEAKYLAVRW